MFCAYKQLTNTDKMVIMLDGVFMETIKYEELHKGKGADVLFYKRDDNTPYTGEAICQYKNGQTRFEAHYKNGVLHGKSTWWNRSGQKEFEATYTNGRMDLKK